MLYNPQKEHSVSFHRTTREKSGAVSIKRRRQRDQYGTQTKLTVMSCAEKPNIPPPLCLYFKSLNYLDEEKLGIVPFVATLLKGGFFVFFTVAFLLFLAPAGPIT